MKRCNIKYMYFTIFVFFSAYSIKFVKPGFIENILSKKTWHDILWNKKNTDTRTVM